MTTPVQVERELSELGEEVDKWCTLSAWHEAQFEHLKTRFAVAEARAALAYQGPVGKTKYAATIATEAERTRLDIAKAGLTLCEKRLYALEKLIFTTLGRNKSIGHAYNTSRY